MPRLLRPHIPLETRCRVVLRQLGEMWPEAFIVSARHMGMSMREMLDRSLTRLADLLNCEVKDLHLDHDPALENRDKVFRKGEHVGYIPDANDPEHLIYREKHAHYIKTHVRGDGAQFSDTTLAKRERRRKKKLGKPVSRKGDPGSTNFRFSANKLKPKRKWGTRPLKSANRWPARGTQKIRSRPWTK